MLYRLIVAAFVLVVGTAAYFGVHYAGTVFADDPPAGEGGKNAIERAAEADQAKPVQNGLVNGIFIAPDSPVAVAADAVQDGTSTAVRDGTDSSQAGPCTDTSPVTRVHIGQAGELNFSYPSDWHLIDEWATACGDTTMNLYREMEPEGDPLADILIMRWRGTRGVELAAAADRVSAVTVAGKKAVHIEPVRTEADTAIDPDQLVVTETWGLTVVVAWQTGDSLSAQEVYESITGATAEETN